MTNEMHLVSNHLLDPNANIDTVIQYAEKRYLMTFLTSGATNGRYTVSGFTPKGGQTYATTVGRIPDGELISGIGWQYKIMGRIQKACEIVGTSAVGTVTAGSATSGGFFSIALKDNMLKPGMNVVFYNGKQARVYSMPTGGTGNYIYKFQCYTGDTFSWTTWVAPQSGTKTCFGGYTSYGEKSIKGYGTTFYPESYINHMTTQRAGLEASGDANADKVLWYELNGQKGFVYEAEMQRRAQFLLEDDFQKFWGKSTMKDSVGNLLSYPSMVDEKGDGIYAGDGWVEQVRGSNDMTTSGTNGAATYDDFSDMMGAIKKHLDGTGGKIIYCITGSDGMQNAHDAIAAYGKNVYSITQNIDQDGTIGGASPAIGFNFEKLNVGGNQIIFVENPMMDAEEKFPRRLSDGRLAMSMTYYFVDASSDSTGRRNIEIKTRGRAGINRNLVYFMENGMTGEGAATSSIDAKQIQMLKQNMLCVYNARTSGILEPSATA